MPKYLMLAINGPKPGIEEDDYNAWYRAQVEKIRTIPGVNSAQRYKVALGKGIDQPYFTAYEVETDDIEAFKADMAARLHPLEPPFDQAMSLALLGEAVD
ncbi:hypothetical protein [Sphingomonas montanisoli]|uniref:DUF4286 family protein n=1 Tax=Sphingomonas montanisoli TaxID=2606412 RepID=A0A5D9C7Z4_9SPHN|nr:hypothetical protein [Sphingomonas montanisoli]TZG27998.1 hypothetical protein FYJ91_10725 [Sphingomonas montanisoli]